jgi:tetratricopeptide (TPR) repeat protein
MASTARIDELKKKFDENPRRYFAPLANEFRKAGDIEQAIMICEEFLPQQAGHMSGHIVYGQALYEAGRSAESRTVFETALTLDPENLIALRHLGDIARANGEMETARHWYTRVLDADPRNDEIQSLLYSLDDAGATVLDETRMAVPGTSATPTPRKEEMKFAPPPRALPELPKTEAVAPPPPPARPPAAPAVPAPGASSPAAGPADGLELNEFVPPKGAMRGDRSLLESLEPGEFSAPAGPVAPLAGLEDTSVGGATSAQSADATALPPLDLDDGMALKAQGDPVAESAPPAPTAAQEFAVPDASAGYRKTPRPSQAIERSDVTDFGALASEESETASQIPPELPPSVIAAEAELIYLVPPDDVPAEQDRESESAPPQTPFVTETMAELFLKQGFRDQAYDVYRQLLAASPHDERLRARVAELQPAPAASSGPNVREFLARMATRRPGERSAAAAPPSDNDFASFDTTPASPPSPTRRADARPSRQTPSASASQMSTGLERGATTTRTASGSIDALFGNRNVGTSEDSAASALAQAFGGATESPSITGKPARTAQKELSLDSVFRDGGARPPRPSGSFSFDQFFSEGASGTGERAPTVTTGSQDAVPPSEPAERTADDISQFNSWLQGLKQR